MQSQPERQNLGQPVPPHQAPIPDDPTQAIESGDPQLTGSAPPAGNESQEEPLKKHGDKLNPNLEHPESGRQGASPA